MFLDSTTKEEALQELITCITDSPKIGDPQAFSDGIFEREALMSTGIGLGVGVPHVRLASIDDLVMAVGLCRMPLNDYDAIDDKPISFIFMIAAGEEQHSEHLSLLSLLSSKLKNKEFGNRLASAESPEAAYHLLTDD